MDPQHRFFLECCWEALENAGYDPGQCTDRSVGVYAGVSMSSYMLLNLLSNRDCLKTLDHVQAVISNDKDHLPTRVSYKLNLKGPSMNVNTACSSSLVSVHLACESLLNGECDMALAGGASITAAQKSGYYYQSGSIFSPDGHCRAFDVRAQGTIFGSGVGVVVLKRLSDALEAGDCIHAIIKGSAINNDGSAKVSYTAPSVEGQATVIAEALAMAEVPAESITYVETHGTGTALGDPIEVAALTQAFRTQTSRVHFCALGSLKTNIGHLDAASGVAGLIKTVLALQHHLLPPSLHFTQPNPAIPFSSSPFYVNDHLTDWHSPLSPRRAGVSSFGIGGTNAHVVLEEAPPMPASSSPRRWHLLPLSARTPSALQTMRARLSSHLQQESELSLADVAYTLQMGRRAFRQRCVLLAEHVSQAVPLLDPQHAPAWGVWQGEASNQALPVIFLFPGQGSQYVEMGRELYEHEPVFRHWVDRASEQLQPWLPADLRQVLYPSVEQRVQAQQWLAQTQWSQPALFVVEYALAQLWMHWGLQPQGMLGHSLGEYVAACVAGVLSLEEALRLVAVRGRLMQQLPAGRMLAVGMQEAEVCARMPAGVELAAVNGPQLCSVAGEPERIEEFERVLQEQGISTRRLATSHAFHSWMMEPMLDAFGAEVQQVKWAAAQIPYVSNLTGGWISQEQVREGGYWTRHLREPVRFAQGLQTVMQEERQILLEVGPGTSLSTLARQIKGEGQQVFSSLPHPHEQQSDEAFLLGTLGRLWLAGAQVDWEQFHGQQRRQRLPLPTYPFERKRHWITLEADNTRRDRPGSSLAKQEEMADWFYVPSWKGLPLPLSSPQVASLASADSWLVFLDENGSGNTIAERLIARGEDVIYVIAGSFFKSSDEQTYMINPTRRSDYITLFQALNKIGKRPTRVLHMWSITTKDGEHSTHSQHAQDRGFYSLLLLAQTINEQWRAVPLHIDVVSTHVCQVHEEAIEADKATLLGPCRVIPLEYPSITCRYIDIVEPRSGTVQEQHLFDQLMADLIDRPDEQVIAYRGGARWVQVLERVRLEKEKHKPQVLREGGVYLITGGLGGIGLILARYLVEAVHAKLILVGRSALPERSEWKQWITDHDTQDSLRKKLVAIQELEKLGAEVCLCTADVADRKQLEAALAEAYERFHKIHGVIHAAGVAGGGIIRQKKLANIDDVFAAKIQGTRILSELFKHAELDFFILCSSLASILGNVGQVDYCAANAFLDAFVSECQPDCAASVVSINWDTWRD
ncbi:MAG TPA: type I polyketide synthase, partial [Ktedonobacteraceae bacterium]|nr:type I polyketide synthase [Ktedonobacteraceae bacterium]